MAHRVDLIFEWIDKETGQKTGLVHDSNTPDYIFLYLSGSQLKKEGLLGIYGNAEPLGVYYCKLSRAWNTVTYKVLLYKADTKSENIKVLEFIDKRYSHLLDLKGQIWALNKMGNQEFYVEKLKKEYRNLQIINLDDLGKLV